VDTGDRVTTIALMAAVFVTARDRPVDATLREIQRHIDLPPIIINMTKTNVKGTVLGTGSGGTVM